MNLRQRRAKCGRAALEPPPDDASPRLLDRARRATTSKGRSSCRRAEPWKPSGRPSPAIAGIVIRSRVNTQALKNLNASLSLAGNSGTPYNITTGFDDNNDSIFNDRPAGVGRNSARTSSQVTVSGTLSYSLALGPAGTARAAAQDRQGGGDRGGQAAGRYRLVFLLSVNNLTNRPNFSGFSGIQTSPFFLTSTSVQNPRKVDLGVSIRF